MSEGTAHCGWHHSLGPELCKSEEGQLSKRGKQTTWTHLFLSALEWKRFEFLDLSEMMGCNIRLQTKLFLSSLSWFVLGYINIANRTDIRAVRSDRKTKGSCL